MNCQSVGTAVGVRRSAWKSIRDAYLARAPRIRGCAADVRGGQDRTGTDRRDGDRRDQSGAAPRCAAPHGIDYIDYRDHVQKALDGEPRSFDVTRDYLWPIPAREVTLNPNLTQNSGYRLRMRLTGSWLLLAVVIACGRAASSLPQTTTPGTGAVSTVVPTETDARVTRVEELLRGVPGLEVTRAPDGSYRLRIRGARSIRGNPTDDDPLLVIDGITVSSGSLSSTLSELTPGDIAQIDVLKDAAATSVYGSRGANGVIVITTKRAR
jgi:TonB-dependent SusC/RagA subfamily outer membrane receptor